MKIIQKNTSSITELCVRYHVAELYVFGSVLTERFKKDSDIDFLVRFSFTNQMEYFDNYMDFKEGLEKIFSRKVDLVEIQTLKNPILKRSINRDKVIIYGRENTKMAV